MKKIIFIIICLVLLTGCDILKKEEVIDDFEEVRSLYYGQIDSDKIAYRNMLFTTYDKYVEFVKHYSIKKQLYEDEFEKNNYIVLIAEDKYCDGAIDKFKGIKLEKDKLNVKFLITKTCKECSIKYYLYLIEVPKDTINEEKDIKYIYEPTNEVYCDK